LKSKVLPIIITAFAAAASVGVVKWLETDAGDFAPPRTNSAPPATRPARVLDLSLIYGRVNLTIFNKKTRVVFARPQEFFDDAGVNSFDGLRFDDVRRLPGDLRLVSGRRLTPREIALIEEGR
jgi:hypothetical protein